MTRGDRFRAVDRNGYCRFRANQVVKGKAAAPMAPLFGKRVAAAIDGFSFPGRFMSFDPNSLPRRCSMP
jgi:hypothetical protein